MEKDEKLETADRNIFCYQKILAFVIYFMQKRQYVKLLGSDILTFTEAVTWWCSIKKVFTKFTGKKTQSCNFIKKEISKQLFSCKLCKNFKNSFFTRHFWTTAFNVCFSPTLYDFVLFSPLLDISHYEIRTS